MRLETGKVLKVSIEDKLRNVAMRTPFMWTT